MLTINGQPFGFNTQPPEGGWGVIAACILNRKRFNTQPPEGGWVKALQQQGREQVSTHSHLKAAGSKAEIVGMMDRVSTHSRLKAAGSLSLPAQPTRRCFNTQPPEGGWGYIDEVFNARQGFNTQPPEGGCRQKPPYRTGQAGFNTQPPEGG